MWTEILIYSLAVGGTWYRSGQESPADRPAGAVATATTRTTGGRVRFPTTQPSVAAAEQEAIVVSEVEGMVQYRADADRPWMKCEVGAKLDEAGELRCGPRSSVMVVRGKQRVTCDRLGRETLKNLLGRTIEKPSSGRIRVDTDAVGVDQIGAEHFAELRSPSSTLAIRRCFVSIGSSSKPDADGNKK